MKESNNNFLFSLAKACEIFPKISKRKKMNLPWDDNAELKRSILKINEQKRGEMVGILNN